MSVDPAPDRQVPPPPAPGHRHLNEETGLKEYLFREAQLGADLQGELEKALAKFENDGRRNSLELLRQRGIEFRGLVLELGAGTCWFSSEISKSAGVSRVVALDFARNILGKLAPLVMERAGADAARVQRVVGDFSRLPFPEMTFDFVVMDAALHHAIRPDAVLMEIGRVLKDDGRFLAIREPVLPLWRRNLGNKIGVTERAQGVTENIFSKKEWRAFFAKAQLDVRFVPTRPTHRPARWQRLKRLAWFLLIPWLNPCLFGYYYFLAKKRRST